MMKRFLLLLPFFTTSYASNLDFSNLISQPRLDYKELRDLDIEKQDLDYSCGSASMATILRSFYGKKVQEKDILDKLLKINKNGVATFDGLSQVADSFDIKAVGMSIDFSKLKKLKVPAILYLKTDETDHFTVIRGINEKGLVHLGDPSWGNIKLQKEKFLKMWLNGNQQGKILLIVPKNNNTYTNKDFFKIPSENINAVRALTNFK